MFYFKYGALPWKEQYKNLLLFKFVNHNKFLLNCPINFVTCLLLFFPISCECGWDRISQFFNKFQCENRKFINPKWKLDYFKLHFVKKNKSSLWKRRTDNTLMVSLLQKWNSNLLTKNGLLKNQISISKLFDFILTYFHPRHLLDASRLQILLG